VAGAAENRAGSFERKRPGVDHIYLWAGLTSGRAHCLARRWRLHVAQC
jgi:hypothetical protein